jgi:hypothetical protein
MSALAVLAAVGAMGLGQVSLRGGEPAPAGAVVRVDAAGVWIGGEGTGPQGPAKMVIGWDRVKSLGTEAGGKAGPWLDLGERAWRGRTRVERGDFIAAEAVLEPLFESMRGQAGATAAVVDEALLRCRLRRGAHVGAIEPWLALIAAGDADRTPRLHADWAGDAGLAPVMDPATGLVAALPPIFLSWPSVDALARSPGVDVAGGNTKTASLASLYVAAARFEAGIPVEVPSVPAGDPGVALVAEIVRSRIGDPAQREAARKQLQERLRVAGHAAAGGGGAGGGGAGGGGAGGGTAAGAMAPWMEAWCRAALGRSLLREDAPEQQRLGVVELLHIPARFAAAHPYLAGVALAEASVQLRRMGDSAGADILAQELQSVYPSHPVRDWLPLRARGITPGGTGAGLGRGTDDHSTRRPAGDADTDHGTGA